MQKNRFSKFIIFAMTCTLLLSALLFFVSSQSTLREKSLLVPSSLINQVSSTFRKPLAVVETFRQETTNLLETYQENKTLKQRLLTLSNQETLIKDLTAENSRLRQELGLKSTYQEFPTIVTHVLVRSSVAWLEEVTVDKGRQQGVTEGMLLASKEGLLGYPLLVGQDTTQVQLLTNTVTSSAIPVVIEGEAPVYGVFMGYDPAKKAFKIGQLNRQTEIAQGSKVLTSGLDGETPAGILLGQVLEVDRVSGQSQLVYVSVAADSDDLSAISFIGRQ